ncbi:MAG: GlxA family transcriptional regulator [Pseudomonadota bacterium]
MTTQFGEKTQTFGFLVVPKFAMLPFTAAMEPLRAANLFAGRDIYAWQVLSLDGQAVVSSNGTAVMPHSSIAEAEKLDNVVVCSGLDAHLINDSQLFGWLRRLERRGARVGALSDGAHVLARAGLLRNHRCTIHWNCLDGFAESFPDIAISSELYCIDRTRFTCSGGTASMDMMLKMIEVDHGRALALQVAEQFMHDRIRADNDRQRMPLRQRLGLTHPRLLRAIEVMEENLELPLALSELAEICGISTRQLERLFAKYLSCTPRRYYLHMRLEKAHALLTQSSMPVMEVALACGFVSASHFAKCYRDLYGAAPRNTRLPKQETHSQEKT